MKGVILTEQGKGHFLIKGDLNRHTVPSCDASIQQRLVTGAVAQKIKIELSGLEHVDTAGLAWLINLLRVFKQSNIQWQLQNIPETMTNLAKISDVDSILSVQ